MTIKLTERQKRILRQRDEREDKENREADFLRGKDDGEPLTTVDYNEIYGATE